MRKKKRSNIKHEKVKMIITEFTITTGGPIPLKRSNPKLDVKTLTRWYDPAATSADGRITFTIEAQKPVKFSNGHRNCNKDHHMDTDHYDPMDELTFDLSEFEREDKYQFTLSAKVRIGTAESQPDLVTIEVDEDIPLLNPTAHENDPA